MYSNTSQRTPLIQKMKFDDRLLLTVSRDVALNDAHGNNIAKIPRNLLVNVSSRARNAGITEYQGTDLRITGQTNQAVVEIVSWLMKYCREQHPGLPKFRSHCIDLVKTAAYLGIEFDLLRLEAVFKHKVADLGMPELVRQRDMAYKARCHVLVNLFHIHFRSSIFDRPFNELLDAYEVADRLNVGPARRALNDYLCHTSNLDNLDLMVQRFGSHKPFVYWSIHGVVANWGGFYGAEGGLQQPEIRGTSPRLFDEIKKVLRGPRAAWKL